MKVEVHISHRRSLNPVSEKGNGNEYLPAAGSAASCEEELDLDFIIDALPKVNSPIPSLKAFLQKWLREGRCVIFVVLVKGFSLFLWFEGVSQTQINLILFSHKIWN